MPEGNIFSIGDGNLIDLNEQSVPNWFRASECYTEAIVDGSLQLKPVKAFLPAFDLETGAFVLEPVGVNLLTHNMDLSQNIWLKGASVSVRVDNTGRGQTAPDGTPRADRLRWDVGNGSSQILKRTVSLQAASDYTLSGILRLAGGLFGGADVIRVVGGVVGAPKLGLAGLNPQINRYPKPLELPFKTAGGIPKYPGNVHQISALTIASVENDKLTLNLPPAYSSAVNDWAGGQLLINGQYYLITGNTASASSQIAVTLSVTGLPSLGITTALKAELKDAPAQAVTIEFYCENTASIDWGGLFLEARNFRTSPIYQGASITIRSGALLTYRKSPIAAMKTFGIFAQLNEWRGDGNLFDFGNLKLWIKGGKLNLEAAGNAIELSEPLPKFGVKFFLQVLESNSTLTLYINGVLRYRTTLNNFRADTYSPLILTSEGWREWQRLLVKDTPLAEGQINVNDAARADVAALFTNTVPIDATAISSHAPLILLPPVTVPPPSPPIAQSAITVLNGAIATVANAAGFVVGAPVIVMRGDSVILRTSVNTISAANITLATAFNAQVGDKIIYGDIDTPGKASIRFPFDAVDTQIIRAVDIPNKKITVDSTLSFTRDRAFVRNDLYQDIAEVIVTDINDTLGWIYVNNITDIIIGQTIAQPGNEQLIDVSVYDVDILTQVEGVRITEKYWNGVVIANTNPIPITVTPVARVNI